MLHSVRGQRLPSGGRASNRIGDGIGESDTNKAACSCDSWTRERSVLSNNTVSTAASCGQTHLSWLCPDVGLGAIPVLLEGHLLANLWRMQLFADDTMVRYRNIPSGCGRDV